jgi:hypothetical protein
MGTGSPAGDVDTPNGRAASNGPCTEDRQVNVLLNDAFVSVLVKSNIIQITLNTCTVNSLPRFTGRKNIYI